jgi:hypothetical protein
MSENIEVLSCDRYSDALIQQIVRSNLIWSIGNNLIRGENALFYESTDLVI